MYEATMDELHQLLEDGRIAWQYALDHYAQLVFKQEQNLSPRYQAVMNRYGVLLSDSENIVPLRGHSGRHTNAYHEFMLNALDYIDNMAGGNVRIFKEGLGIMRDFLVINPGLPYAK